ncbi:molybdate ABC transporter substrate-binding protein [Psychrobacter sanguinis]|uniref:molybdate ABC transporter substrate-binding protein n=1 Tax=Psychrobacter sanguinis TaxID=861445 RepID=UPI00020C7A37|nr:molybdate ABC transporter substrate-binding protein [Psychrobacter sanguinis]EGK13850.1 molybdate ABC superfamily ATP binding cassette transporter, binding protein [Psychrobacter sp. 1501(2011)]MCD9150507.1 molybdate ABC transporter substrate-binding protein [Psychrobacter sanguinis]
MNLNLKLIATLPFYLLLASCSNDAKIAQTHPDSQSETSAQHSTDVLRIAAAANLAGVLPAVIDAYETSDTQTSKNQKPKIEVTYASSGKLFAQINSGAPYDIFLSADQDFPAKYAQQQTSANATIQTPFTYTRGQLALYSSNQDLGTLKTLDKASLQHLFITQPSESKTTIKITLANPELAPYGASAKSFLQQQGLYNTLSNKKVLIQAENIGQAFQYAHTATTDYGFVALSQLISAKLADSKYIILQPESYPAILQDGIVIRNSTQATDLSNYLQSEPAQKLFAEAGYLPVG